MLNLEKALIPKPQKLKACGKTVKIAEFNSPAFTIDAIGEDVRIAEAAALIRAKLFDIAAVDTEGGDYKTNVCNFFRHPPTVHIQ